MAPHTLTAEELDVVTGVFRGMAALSLVASTLLLASFVAYPRLRAFPGPLVLVLAVLDVATITSYLMSPSTAELAAPAPTRQCVAQATMMTWTVVAGALWPAGIAVVVYLRVVRGVRLEAAPARTVAVMACVAFSVASALAGAAAAAGVYGAAGPWCWITAAYPTWRWTTAYLVGWLSCAVSVVAATALRLHGWRALRDAKANGGDALVEALQLRVRRAQLYPLVLLVVWFWPTVNRLYESMSGNQVLALFVLHRGFQGLSGVLNTVAFGFAAREQLYHSLQPTLAACCPRVERALAAGPATVLSSPNPLLRGARGRSGDAAAADGSDGGIQLRDTPSGRSGATPEWGAAATTGAASTAATARVPPALPASPSSPLHRPATPGGGTRAGAVATAMRRPRDDSDTDGDDDAEAELPGSDGRGRSTSGMSSTRGTVTYAAAEGRSRLSIMLSPDVVAALTPR